jgi:hypothetical protein
MPHGALLRAFDPEPGFGRDATRAVREDDHDCSVGGLPALLLALILLVRHRRELVRTGRDGLVTPYEELEEADRVAAGQ